jgi:hypothetical protein
MKGLGFDSLPIWRKTVIVCAIASTCVIGVAVTAGELHFYLSAATTPNATTGEMFPVYVLHRYLRYLTATNYERLTFWRPLVGLPALALV